MPVGTFPQRPVDDAAWYPLYATCVDLGIPIFLLHGHPRARGCRSHRSTSSGSTGSVTSSPSSMVVTRHGCEPWEALVVKLMLKWPNLYYSTSAFAPKYYPKAIVDYANTRGADKVIYAGYFPFGLSYETIFSQLPNVGLRDHVWPEVPPRERPLASSAWTDGPDRRDGWTGAWSRDRSSRVSHPTSAIRACSAAFVFAGVPVLVARGEDGVLRAFTNTCRHRRPVLAAERERAGQATAHGFTCPFHGWTRARRGVPGRHVRWRRPWRERATPAARRRDPTASSSCRTSGDDPVDVETALSGVAAGLAPSTTRARRYERRRRASSSAATGRRSSSGS